MDWKQLRERQEEPARKTVHARLVLDAVAAARGVRGRSTTSSTRASGARRERIGERHDEAASRGSEEEDGLEALKTQMVREKTLDYLTSVANIQVEE